MDSFTDQQRDFLCRTIADVKERFVREMDQALLKRDLYQAVGAMCGREACDRIAAELKLREEMHENAAFVERMDELKREQKRLLRRADLVNRRRSRAAG